MNQLERTQITDESLTESEQQVINIIKQNPDQKIDIQYGQKGVEEESLSLFLNLFSSEQLTKLLNLLTAKKKLEKTKQICNLHCPKCGHEVNATILTCPNCGSKKIANIEFITHRNCGYTAPKRDFVQGPNIICPNCHDSIEYNKTPEHSQITTKSYQICMDCNTKLTQNNINMICLNCKSKYHPDQANVESHITYRYVENIKNQEEELELKTGLNSRVLQPNKPKIKYIKKKNSKTKKYTPPKQTWVKKK